MSIKNDAYGGYGQINILIMPTAQHVWINTRAAMADG